MARMTLDELVKQLRAAYGTALRSIVLYGSSAGGEAGAKKQDHNVLVIVDSLDAPRLRAASAASRAWVDAGNHAPLTLTREEWRGSADIFPWSTRTFSTVIACCTASRPSTGSELI